MLLRAFDGHFRGFQGSTVLDHGTESMAAKRISGLSMKFLWESQKGFATGVNPVPELLSPTRALAEIFLSMEAPLSAIQRNEFSTYAVSTWIYTVYIYW